MHNRDAEEQLSNRHACTHKSVLGAASPVVWRGGREAAPQENHPWALLLHQFHLTRPPASRSITTYFYHHCTSQAHVLTNVSMFPFPLSDSSSIPFNNTFRNIVSFGLPAVLLFAVYFGIYMEISNYWTQLFADSQLELNEIPEYASRSGNTDLNRFRSIWIINYSMLFFTVLAFANFKKIKNQTLGIVNMIFIVFGIFLFLSSGLYALSDLRESYLTQNLAEYYDVGIFHIVIRYISIGIFALMMFTGYQYLKQDFIKLDLRTSFNVLLHTAILWILSSELIHLLDMAGAGNSYKLGLTILWGAYALFMIALGILKSRKHLRISAFVILGITILKLFFYDISNLNTIAKTIVFVSLGILLLIISFLYNKYKQTITDETKQ